MTNVMATRIGRLVVGALAVLVLAPVSADAGGCFNPAGEGASFTMIVIELAGGTAPFFSLVGEVVTNTAQGRVSSPVAGSAFVRADGTVPFTLLGAVDVGPVIGTLSPPAYDRGVVQGVAAPIPIAAVPCPSVNSEGGSAPLPNLPPNRLRGRSPRSNAEHQTVGGSGCSALSDTLPTEAESVGRHVLILPASGAVPAVFRALSPAAAGSGGAAARAASLLRGASRSSGRLGRARRAALA
jgi:hypothetical protein